MKIDYLSMAALIQIVPLQKLQGDLYLDRSFLQKAQALHQISPEWRYGDYDEIFLGHTPNDKFRQSRTPEILQCLDSRYRRWLGCQAYDHGRRHKTILAI